MTGAPARRILLTALGPVDLCEVCDKPMTSDESDPRDGDEVCRRSKPYCTNKEHAVDWRARAIEWEQAVRNLQAQGGWSRAHYSGCGQDGIRNCAACALEAML